MNEIILQNKNGDVLASSLGVAGKGQIYFTEKLIKYFQEE